MIKYESQFLPGNLFLCSIIRYFSHPMNIFQIFFSSIKDGGKVPLCFYWKSFYNLSILIKSFISPIL
jgi:hypothetical protein